jgi:hypothetical protein
MTSRERILAAVRHQPHDRVPVCPRLNPFCVNQIGLALANQLLDRTDPCWFVQIGGLEIFLGKAVHDRVSTTERGGRVCTTISTPLGELRRVQRLDPERRTTWEVEDFFKDQADVERFLSLPYRPAEPDLEEYSTARVLVGERGVVKACISSALCLPAGWFDPETFNLYSIQRRDLILELLEVVNERVVRFASRAAELGVEWFWMAGPEYAGPPLMHPRCYDVFARPFDEQLVAAVQAHGAVHHTHMHGSVRQVLDSILRSGTDVISPLEAPPQGDVSLPEVLATFGRRVCLMGNLDDYGLLGAGDLPAVRRRAAEAVHAWNDTGGDLLLGGTDDATQSPAMAEAFLEVARISRELSVPR